MQYIGLYVESWNLNSHTMTYWTRVRGLQLRLAAGVWLRAGSGNGDQRRSMDPCGWGRTLALALL